MIKGYVRNHNFTEQTREDIDVSLTYNWGVLRDTMFILRSFFSQREGAREIYL